MSHELQKVIFDGKSTWKLKCPDCGTWGFLDEDQFNGRVSTLCNCGFHETVNFTKEVKKW